MTYAETILPEFDAEMANTRLVLASVPDEKFNWKSHPKSNTMGWNVNHLIEIPGWVEGTLTQPDWDIAPEGGEIYKSPSFTNREEALKKFDENVATGRAAIQNVDESTLQDPWSLKASGEPLFTMPRAAVIRTFVLNHTIHHRAMLCSYLRLNDIPVPGMYGPSGD